MAKVVKSPSVVLLHYMQDGSVAEVMSSDNQYLKVGTVIERYEDTIILIGESSGKSFPHLVNSSKEGKSKIEVDILPKGALIQL